MARKSIESPIEDHLKAHLSFYEMESLSEQLGYQRFRAILRKPERANSWEIGMIANYLQSQKIELINKFNCGIDKVTVREYQAILKEAA